MPMLNLSFDVTRQEMYHPNPEGELSLFGYEYFLVVLSDNEAVETRRIYNSALHEDGHNQKLHDQKALEIFHKVCDDIKKQIEINVQKGLRPKKHSF